MPRYIRSGLVTEAAMSSLLVRCLSRTTELTNGLMSHHLGDEDRTQERTGRICVEISSLNSTPTHNEIIMLYFLHAMSCCLADETEQLFCVIYAFLLT